MEAAAQISPETFFAAVADYNRAQFRLYTALGNPPLCSLNNAVAIPMEVETVPHVPQREEEGPQPRPIH